MSAYAALLHQDRPDSMVSDQLRPTPEPAAPPAGDGDRELVQEPVFPA